MTSSKTFTQNYRVIHINCQFIHFVRLFRTSCRNKGHTYSLGISTKVSYELCGKCGKVVHHVCGKPCLLLQRCGRCGKVIPTSCGKPLYVPCFSGYCRKVIHIFCGQLGSGNE